MDEESTAELKARIEALEKKVNAMEKIVGTEEDWKAFPNITNITMQDVWEAFLKTAPKSVSAPDFLTVALNSGDGTYKP